LAALLDLLGIAKAVVIGHDWGSFTSGRFALWHPDRLLALVMLSVPFTPPAPRYLPLPDIAKLSPNLGYQLYFADEKSEREIESNIHTFFPVLYRRPGQGLNFTPQGELRKIIVGERKVDDLMINSLLNVKELEYYVSQYKSMHGPLSYYRTTKTRFEEEKAAGLPSKLRPDLPVLLIWGMRDPTARAMNPQKAGAFVPKLQDMALEGKGHWLMLEAKDVVTDKVAEWLCELGLLPSPKVNL